MKYKKIIIIGSCGSGKSRLSKKIHKKLSLPLVNLDSMYWNAGWVATPKDKWRGKIRKLVEADQWILEGNYQSTFDIKFPACDTVVFLDRSRFVCFWRIVKRRYLKDRSDKIENCKENLNFKFIKWVLWGYPGEGRRLVLEYIEKYKNKNIFILRSNGDAQSFLDNL